MCRSCGRSVFLRYGTAYFGLESDPAIFEMATRALAEGNSLHSTARIVGIDPETVHDWLDMSAQHCRQVMMYFWRDLPVSECQLDELWSFVHTKEGNLEAAKLFHETYGDAWVWVAFAPEWRLFLGFVIGKRTQNNANIMIKRVHHIINGRLPLFTSDQLPEYRTALLEAYGQWVQPERTSQRGRPPKRRLVPCPGLLYAQVVKRKERGHLVDITTKTVFGDEDTIRARLVSSTTSNSINTSFVERGNLVLRQGNRRLTRKTNGFSKESIWLEKQLWMSLAYYHFVLPHQSLRRKLGTEEPTRGSGSHRRWQSITPAMAAGMTDRVWSTSDLFSYRVPATFLDRLSEVEHLFSSVWSVSTQIT
ncbi:MAG: helix-turn-helix domain-containing protein [Magnetococcales bacterium]|nr:helix-turn-helix domain-containing protein [Magnetococcales bacterium]